MAYPVGKLNMRLGERIIAEVYFVLRDNTLWPPALTCLYLSIILVPEGLMPSSGFHRHKTCKWYTDIHAKHLYT